MRFREAPGRFREAPGRLLETVGGSRRAQKAPGRLQEALGRLQELKMEAPGGGGGASKWLPKSIQKRPWLQSSVFPPPEALQEPILTSSGLDFGASGADFRGLGRFIGSLAGSTFAAKRLANKWWSAVLAEP